MKQFLSSLLTNSFNNPGGCFALSTLLISEDFCLWSFQGLIRHECFKSHFSTNKLHNKNIVKSDITGWKKPWWHSWKIGDSTSFQMLPLHSGSKVVKNQSDVKIQKLYFFLNVRCIFFILFHCLVFTRIFQESIHCVFLKVTNCVPLSFRVTSFFSVAPKFLFNLFSIINC